MTPEISPSSARIPRAVLWPGLAGLIPFWALGLSALYPVGIAPVFMLYALITYGAVILSFVGAIWWGMAAASPLAVTKTPFFFWSVVPALIGWFATLIAPDTGVLLLATGFFLQWLFDAWLALRGPDFMPRWVFPVRTILTAGVLGSLATAWWLLV